MPLSEDEQRILQDLERSLYQDDPAFARVVGSDALYRHARRNCRLALAGFVLSLLVLLGTFTSSFALAFVGFIGMVACAAVFVQNTKRIGAAGFKDVAESARARQMEQQVRGARRRLGGRFRRPQN